MIDTGRSIAQVARDIGVGEQLLGRWVAIERSRMDDPPDALDIDERAELDRLRREVTELRMDREFLNKAAAFFATENSNPSGRSVDRRAEGHLHHRKDGRAAPSVAVRVLRVGAAAGRWPGDARAAPAGAGRQDRGRA